MNEYTFDKKGIHGFPGLPLFLGSPGAWLETRSISFDAPPDAPFQRPSSLTGKLGCGMETEGGQNPPGGAP